MYYYKRKASPLKWFLIIIIIIALGALGYWFYDNYFSKIDFAKPDQDIEIEDEDDIFDMAKILKAQVLYLEGKVESDIDGSGYVDAAVDLILEQGGMIKTGADSKAIIKLDNDSIIRLGPETEIILNNLKEDAIKIIQNSGRTYHNISSVDNYQVKSLQSLVTATGTKFEVITNPLLDFIAVLNIEGKVKAEVIENNDMIMAVGLAAGEKALLDLKKDKNNLITIEQFTKESIIWEDWYKWNFERDIEGEEGQEDVEDDEGDEDDEPDFEVIDESLQLSAQADETSVSLSWSAYNKDNFKSYQIIRSQTNNDLKYPDTGALKSSTDKGFSSYFDSGVEPGKKYYYRICAVKNSDKVACGNVASVEIEETEEDTNPPIASTLSISISVSGVSLSWTHNTDDDFKEYAVLKSITNPSPAYAADMISSTQNTDYLDNTVNITSVGNFYYRVCSLDTSDNVSCSNVQIIEDGKVK